MCAALYAASRGKRPLIIEKLDKIGGTTGYSGGILWLPNNPVSRRAGVEDSFEKSRQYMDAVIGEVGPASTPARRDSYVRESARMVEFLEQKGLPFLHSEWCDYYDDKPGGLVRGRSLHCPLLDLNELGEWQEKLSIYPLNTMPLHIIDTIYLSLIKRRWDARWRALKLAGRMLSDRLTGRKRRGWGAALQGRMLMLCVRENIPIWTKTPAERFLVEDGRVVGVLARHLERAVRIRGIDGVLINAGGFSRNQAMRDRYQRQPTSAQWTNVNPGDTGEVQRVAMEIGAAVDLMDQAWWNLGSLNPDGSFPYGTRTAEGDLLPFMQSYDIAKPHGMVVDQSGRRFFNEAVAYMEQVEQMYRRHQSVPAIPSWQIMDRRHRNQYFWANQPPGKIPREWLDSGYLKKADSLEDLARQCQIEPEGLLASVSRFNGFARRGVDEDFHRGENGYARFIGDPTYRKNPSLGTIEQPPFYAVAMYPGDVGTSGGLLTDEHARVLHEDGSVIEGLYATGNSTASVMGKSYPGAGASVGPSFVFGFVAARHATDE